MMNPKWYTTATPAVRKQAIKSLMKLGTIALTITSLAKMGGASVESDPRSSDFGKIKVGNTRYDIGGGFNQWITLGARLQTGQTKTISGDIKELGEGFGSDDEFDITMKFLRNKLSPVLGTAVTIKTGKNPVGEAVDTKTELGKLFYPMIANDIMSIQKDQGSLTKGAAMAIPGVFGVGSQTYSPKPSEADHMKDIKPELDSIKEAIGKDVVGKPQRTLFRGTDYEKKLTDEEYEKYVTLSGQYINDDVKEEMAQEGWSNLSNEDKFDIIKEVAASARKDARNELFPDEEETVDAE